VISCGAGQRDSAVIDSVDPTPRGCEHVRIASS
jgi:hypothetical protein